MNEKIILPDLINLLCEKQGMDKKDAELFVKTMFDLIKEALDKDKYVKIKGLGTFKLTEVGSRESVHINTGERIEIQGHTKISFTPDATMKDLINKPFAHFESVVLNDGVELEDTPIETPEEPMLQEEVVVAPAPVIEKTPAAMEEPIAEEPAVEEPATEEPIVDESTKETVVVEEATVETPAEEMAEEVVEEEVVEEVIPEVEVEQPVEEKVVPEEVKKEKSINRILWGVIVVLVLIILFGAYWMFFRSEDVPEPVPAPPVQEEIVTPAPAEEVKPQEETQKIVQFIKLSEEEFGKERVPSLADTLDCEIVGTQEEYTLQKGETIIRASVRFFGTKKYWPYLVKHNMDVLPDPDNIPAGIRIKIPKLVEKSK